MQRDIDEAEALLLKWADWMRQPEIGAAWYPEKAAGGFIGSWIKDSEEEAENQDAYEIGKINACIDSLIQPHTRIIYKRFGLSHNVWHFSDEEGLYAAAKAAFRVKYFGR